MGADPAWAVPGSLDPDPGNGRSDAAGSTGRAAVPLEHPSPPPRPSPVLAGAHSQQVIRRPPHSGIVFRSFSFAVCPEACSFQTALFILRVLRQRPRRLSFLGRTALSDRYQNLPTPRKPGQSTCAVLGICAAVFLPFRRQLLQRRSRPLTWSTPEKACVPLFRGPEAKCPGLESRPWRSLAEPPRSGR